MLTPIVISHERSGTHFLINTLADILGYSRKPLNVHIDHGPDRYNSEEYHAQVVESIHTLASKARGKILKTHHHHEFFKDINFEDLDLVPFYIYRDVRDTMVSCHHYFNAHKALGNFPVTNSVYELMFGVVPHKHIFDSAYSWNKNQHMVERWTSHVKPYLDDERITTIKYEELSYKFSETVDIIRQRLGLTDTSEIEKSPVGSGAAVAPHRGKVGDWKLYISMPQNLHVLEFLEERGIE